MSDTNTYTVSKMLQCEVSLFSSVFNKESKWHTLGNVLKDFTSQRYAKTIREAREYLLEGDTEMYKACKSMLPVVAFSGVFENGHSKANLVRYNNIVIIDIDHLSEETLSTVAEQLQQDEYVFAYWKSPSGLGVKALVHISGGDERQLDEHHCQAFRQLTDYFKTKYSIDIDQSGFDYSRLCYACWDEDLVIKQTAKLFAVDKPTKAVREKSHQPHSISTPQGGASDRQSDIDSVRDIIRYLRSTGRSITHEYENWVRVAYAIAATFSPQFGETFFLLLSQQDADKFDPEDCRRLLDYCYAHTNGQTSFGTIIYLARKAGYSPNKYNSIESREKQLANIPTPNFVDIILRGGESGDEAMYYLLHQRLERQLRSRFEVYQHQLMDDFEDVVEDFFLYLREGKSGWNKTPYQSLRRIRKKEAFEAWILNTFRNYLTVRAEAEKQMSTTSLHEENIAATDTASSPLTDERKLAIASTLIAYAHQTLYPRDRFIFLRTLLTLLNKQQALPNDEMARALGMSDIAYRVCVHRLKGKLSYIRTRLLRNGMLPLDEPHRQMTQHINDEFSQLYPTIGKYYVLSIDELKRADAVKRLRQEYYETTGRMLHEPEADYSLSPSISAFWTRLSRFLVA